MTTTNCKKIRGEIDESDQSLQMTPETRDHLGACADCRTFQAERRALQRLMASLDKVGAPSDFDFRLRARLAREKSRPQSGVGSFLIISRPVAAVALVLLVAVAGVLIKNLLVAKSTSPSIAQSVTGRRETKPATPAPASLGPETSNKKVPLAAEKNNEGSGPKTVATERHTGRSIRNNGTLGNSAVARQGQGTATREFGSSPAAVLVSQPRRDAGLVVLVPLDARALKISIDNGRGTSRTISLPTFSFGSQRLVARESFLAPVSTAKGVW